jgi:hypothetical protein
VHLISLSQQELGQVRPVLPRDPRYQCLLHGYLLCPTALGLGCW